MMYVIAKRRKAVTLGLDMDFVLLDHQARNDIIFSSHTQTA
jgi:hypothetical protein